MNNKNNKKYWLIGGAIAVVVIGWTGLSMMQGGSSVAVDIHKPTPLFEFAQKVIVTPEEGALLRTADDAGVVMTLSIPPGAVSEVIELTVTPIIPNENGLQHGLVITPSEIVFSKPVTLSYNWYFANQLKGTTIDAESMVAMKFLRQDQTVRVVSLLHPMTTNTYLPVSIYETGWYGVSDNSTLQGVAAERTLKSGESTSAMLEAGLVLFKLNDIRSSEKKIVQSEIDTVFDQSEPDLHELALASKLNTLVGNKLSIVTKAYAYGSFDGYLQFRCNHPDTDYEDAMMAMDIALNMGYSSVVDTCLERAKEILLVEAQKVDNDPSRPTIDTLEVLIQMQLLGLDDGGGEGAKIAERLSDDLIATADAKYAALGQEPDKSLKGRVRPDGSKSPLEDGETTLIFEMLGVGMSNFMGIKAWDKSSLNEFADEMHENMSILLEISDEMCDTILYDPDYKAVLADLDFINESDLAPVIEDCKKVQAGDLQRGLDQWEVEMGEYAEGVDSTQRGKKPQEGWDDFSEADAYFE